MTASGSTPNSAASRRTTRGRSGCIGWTGEPGSHVVEARAIDKAGEIQPEEPAAPAPNGAQGYHRINLDIVTPDTIRDAAEGSASDRRTLGRPADGDSREAEQL